MKLLFVSPRYPPAIGGAENHLAAVAEHLANRGHQITVATTTAITLAGLWEAGHQHTRAGRSDQGNLSIFRFAVAPVPGGDISFRGLRRATHITSRWPNIAAKISALAPRVPNLIRWLRENDEKWDAVIAFNIAYEGLFSAAAGASRRINRPFVVFPLTHLGAGAQPGHDRVSRFYAMTHQRRLVGSADLLVAQTPTEAGFYQAEGWSPNNTVVVGPGVDPAAVTGGDAVAARRRWQINGPLVLSLGTASFDKGTPDVIEAARRLWRKGQKFDLIVAGGQAADFKKWAAENASEGRHPHLHLIGPVSEQEKRNLLAAAAMLVLPSRIDSFGIVYLEAWLNSCPVIAAQAWGIADIVQDGKNGLLVPYGDQAALDDAIKKLLNDTHLAKRLGQTGRDYVLTQHTWQIKLPILEKAIEDTVTMFKTAKINSADKK